MEQSFYDNDDMDDVDDMDNDDEFDLDQTRNHTLNITANAMNLLNINT